MSNLVDDYKSIVPEKQGNPQNLAETFFLYWSFLQICLEICQMLKLSLLSHEILVQGFTMPILVKKYKTVSGETEANLEIFQKRTPYIGVSYKFVLKWYKNLN